MRVFKTILFALIASAASVFSPCALAAPYTLVEGYNVLDTVNAPAIGTNFAATSGQERDLAVDAARGIIYMARGLTTTADGRPGGSIAISAIVVTNDALPGSNYRDTGLITSPGGWCQSLAYDPGSDKLWVLGGPLGANPGIYSAPGGTLGGAPAGDNISAVNSALTREFQVVANLPDGIANHGRGGQPRGFAVRTVGTNTTVYLGMGNHVEAWSNDQSMEGTNSVWRRVWATLRPPAANLASTRVATNFTGVNGIAVDDTGNCYFGVQVAGGRMWCVRPEIVETVADPFALDFNDTALGGGSEWDILPVLINGSASASITNNPQSITFCRFDNQKTLFVSFLPGTLQRAVTRLDLADEVSFENGPHFRATVVDGFGSGQPEAGQDGVLATMRLRGTAGATQPTGATQGLLYTDVNSVTNPTFIYANAFVTDTNKGQTIPTSAILKIQIPEDTNAPAITAQPSAQTLLEGGSISISVGATGQRPLSYQWQSNSVDIMGQTTPNLSITPASTNDSGLYSVVISNIHGSITSTQVLVTVRPLVRSGAMTPLWSNAPGSRPYLTSDNTQRGLAYSPDGNHVVVVSRSPSNSVYLLDAETGEDVFPLTLGPNVAGGTFAINAAGAAEDGHIYVANLAQGTNQFRIYRWDFAEMGAGAQVAYSGNPVADNPRWGDTLAVRGSGNDIQILAGSRSSNIVALFTTADAGQTFSATPIVVADATNGAFGLGIGFGPGNTFWGKGDSSTGLRHVQFDPVAGTGVVLHTFDTNYPGGATALGIENSRNLLAAVSIENPDNLRLYSIADPDAGLPLLDQELFPTDNENINATGAVAFGGGKVFALDSNNGILALTLGSVGPPPGGLTIRLNGTIVTLTWEGLGFTLQSADAVTGPYEDIPGVVSGYTEDTTSFGTRFFRLRN